MQKKNYSSVIVSLGIIALVIGLFSISMAVRDNLDEYNAAITEMDSQLQQGKDFYQGLRDMRDGTVEPHENPQAQAQIDTLSDNTIGNMEKELADNIDEQKAQVKSVMYDNIVNSVSKELALVILGIALLFISKALKELSGKEDSITNNDD